ncbi:replication initiator protein A [Staphylococcus agnetis]|uniref:replication initiator protein A n=1 Tax=Staphylococcus agnetis TaxID=985762 RepID=UPI00208FB8B2|nr:replication initiator protein A [Staphylococcus agnetis]MCO4327865.1 replication initiator protein A [Staphylococcus agnetis]
MPQQLNINNFYKFYRFVNTEEKYRNELCHNSKLLYMVLIDEYEKMSRYHQNNPTTEYFKDDNGRTYITFTREKLSELLNLNKCTITRLKKQLLSCELISEVRVGNNKPNRIYVNIPSHITNTGFIRLPKQLLTDSYYKNTSSVTKIVYAYLSARFNMSIENEYKNDEGKVCCKYGFNSLCEDAQLSRPAFTKAKKELIALGLLKQYNDGTRYNLNYVLLEPNEHNEQTKDLEAKTSSETNKENETDNKHASTHVQNGGCKNYSSEVAKNYSSEVAKTAHKYTTLSYTTNNNTCTNDESDMYDMYTSNTKEKSLKTHNNHNQNNVKNFEICSEEIKNRYLQKYPMQIQLALKGYALNAVKTYISIICNVKNKMNVELGRNYSLEDMEYDIARKIDTVTLKLKSNKKQETPLALCGYLKTAMIDCIDEFDIQVTLEDLRNVMSEVEVCEAENSLRNEKSKRMKKYRENLA